MNGYEYERYLGTIRNALAKAEWNESVGGRLALRALRYKQMGLSDSIVNRLHWVAEQYMGEKNDYMALVDELHEQFVEMTA